MLKGSLAAATVAAALAVAGAATATAASGHAAAAKARSVTLHLVRKDIGFNFVDNPPRQGLNAPALIGDQFAFTSNLLTPSGARVGTFDAVCTVTRGGVNPRQACYGFYALKGGQLSGMAVVTNARTNHVSIVGGTGIYAGVTGSATEVPRGENNPLTDITVHLLYP